MTSTNSMISFSLFRQLSANPLDSFFLLDIFSYLTHKNICRLLLVCTKWKELIFQRTCENLSAIILNPKVICKNPSITTLSILKTMFIYSKNQYKNSKNQKKADLYYLAIMSVNGTTSKMTEKTANQLLDHHYVRRQGLLKFIAGLAFVKMYLQGRNQIVKKYKKPYFYLNNILLSCLPIKISNTFTADVIISIAKINQHNPSFFKEDMYNLLQSVRVMKDIPDELHIEADLFLLYCEYSDPMIIYKILEIRMKRFPITTKWRLAFMQISLIYDCKLQIEQKNIYIIFNKIINNPACPVYEKTTAQLLFGHKLRDTITTLNDFSKAWQAFHLFKSVYLNRDAPVGYKLDASYEMVKINFRHKLDLLTGIDSEKILDNLLNHELTRSIPQLNIGSIRSFKKLV